MRLLAIHNATYSLALMTAGGFIGAYLLRLGFGLPAVLALYAALFVTRFALRQLAATLARRVGYRRTLMLALAVIAAQFIPLAIGAQRPPWLLVWLACIAGGESLYWPIYHAAVAVSGSSERRGREMGLRAALTAAASILGPILGGVILTHAGPRADFLLGGAIVLAAIPPLALAVEFPLGPPPRLRETFRGVDRLALGVFLADGLICSALSYAWPVIYFLLLGGRYEVFGLANAAAGAVGFAVSLLGGQWIDRRREGRGMLAGCIALLAAGFALRLIGDRVPAAANFANLTSVAVNSAYVPLMMSALYERAKRAEGAFRFHLALEAAWDAGVVMGLLASAAILWRHPHGPTLGLLPGAAGVAMFAALMWRGRRGHYVAVA